MESMIDNFQGSKAIWNFWPFCSYANNISLICIMGATSERTKLGLVIHGLPGSMGGQPKRLLKR